MGQEIDASKEYVFFHSYQKANEDDGYKDILKTLTAEAAKKRLKSGECLSILLTSDTCHSCESFLPSFRSLYSEIGLECFRMDCLEAVKLKAAMGYDENSRFGHGTPTWYFLTASSISVVLYPDTSYQDALKRTVRNAYTDKSTAYNAYRVYDRASYEAIKKNGDAKYFCSLDYDDEESLTFYTESFLPFLAKTKEVSCVFDMTFLSTEEKNAIKQKD